MINNFCDAMKNFDVGLQFLVSALRPVLFTLAVSILKDQQSHRSLIELIGYIGLFSISDSLAQSYARACDIHHRWQQRDRVRWLALAATLALSLLVLLAGSTSLLQSCLIIIYVLNSYFLLYERQLSRKLCIVVSSLLELLLMGVTASALLLQVKPSIILFFAFACYPTARLSGLALTRLWHLLARHREDLLIQPPAVAPESAAPPFARYIVFSVLLQVICATTASVPALFNLFYADHARYGRTLIYLRWVNTFGSLASLLVNVFGPRIFYKSIDTRFFVNSAHALAGQRSLLRLAFLSVIAALLLLTARPTPANLLLVLCLSTAIIAFFNYCSSLMLAFKSPDLSLLCQLLVLAISCFSCALCFLDRAVAVLFLGLVTVIFFGIFGKLMRTSASIV